MSPTSAHARNRTFTIGESCAASSRAGRQMRTHFANMPVPAGGLGARGPPRGGTRKPSVDAQRAASALRRVAAPQSLRVGCTAFHQMPQRPAALTTWTGEGGTRRLGVAAPEGRG